MWGLFPLLLYYPLLAALLSVSLADKRKEARKCVKRGIALIISISPLYFSRRKIAREREKF